MNTKCNGCCTTPICFYQRSTFSFKCPCDICVVKAMCNEPCTPFLNFKTIMNTAIVNIEENQLNEWIEDMRIQLQKQKDMHPTNIL